MSVPAQLKSRRPWLAALLFASLAILPTSRADYPVGLEAYQRGDYDAALSEFLFAAQQGDARAQNMIGLMYDLGRGLPEDDEVAVRWYRLAAAQGHASAQYNLGLMHLRGTGVGQDDAEALRWIRKAAEQGHASAQNRVGLLYDAGQGVAEDDEEAVHWYGKAAEQGNSSAQYNLGLMYEAGTGVARDYKQALRWMRMAAAQDHEKAKEKIPTLEETVAKLDGGESDGGATEASERKTGLLTEEPAIYSPEELTETIVNIFYLGLRDAQLPEAFGADLFYDYLPAEFGVDMPGYHGGVELMNETLDALIFFVFDRPASARAGFEYFAQNAESDETPPLARGDVWDKEAGRNISMGCTHPALSEAAPPSQLECMLHDPQTQVVIGINIRAALETAEQRDTVRNLALDTIVAALNAYRESVQALLTPLPATPKAEAQPEEEEESGPADPEALIAELSTPGFRVSLAGYLKAERAIEPPFAVPQTQVYQEADPVSRERGLLGRVVIVMNEDDSQSGIEFFIYSSADAAKAHLSNLTVTPESMSGSDSWSLQLSSVTMESPSTNESLEVECARAIESEVPKPRQIRCAHHLPDSRIAVATYAYYAEPPRGELDIQLASMTAASILQTALKQARRIEEHAPRAKEDEAPARDPVAAAVLSEMTRLAAEVSGAVANTAAFVNSGGGAAVRLLHTRGVRLSGTRLLIDRRACLALLVPDSPQGAECRKDALFKPYPLEIDLAKVDPGGMRVESAQKEQGVRGLSVRIGCVKGEACGRIAADDFHAKTVAEGFGETLERPALFLGCNSDRQCVRLVQTLSALAAMARDAPAGMAAAAADSAGGLVGRWRLQGVGIMEFRDDGTYSFQNPAYGHAGTYSAQAGIWSLSSQTPTMPWEDGGTYRLLDPDRLELVGKLGGATWARDGSP